MKKNRVILIANSDQVKNINDLISSTDIIVRFNLPKLETINITGNRTDYLFVANTHDLAAKKIKKNSRFMNFYNKNLNDSKIIFPYSNQLIQKIKPYYIKKNFLLFKKTYNNWNNDAFYHFLSSHKINIEILDESYYWAAHKSIMPSENEIISTGLLAYFYFSSNKKFKDYSIVFNGFSFEGWSGHNWNAEKNYVSTLKKTNLISILCK